jgi:hypothetical protein
VQPTYRTDGPSYQVAGVFPGYCIGRRGYGGPDQPRPVNPTARRRGKISMIKRSGGDVRRQSGMDIGDGYGYRDRGVWLGGGRGLRGSWQSCLSDPDSRDTVYRRRACFSPPSPFGKSADGVSMLPGAPARPPALSRARLTRICMSHFAVVGACWAGCSSGHTNLSADPQTALVGALPDGPAP